MNPTPIFDRRFPAELSQLRQLRQLLRQGLQQAGVPGLFADRLLLVVDEVISNSIEHGREYRSSEKPLRVSVSREEEGGLVLEVDDIDVPDEKVQEIAKELENSRGIVPAALLERGRGLFLVHTFLENLEIRAAAGGGMRLIGRLPEKED